ncbi:Uncharacterised protein [Vibrio cholerae]|nr:Uncharacterised protein [Vibrio cholerae]CSB41812.1 Uncharacterised protein [Vibrio cholerae]CSB80983.1 Uncharacterised protein [Vibrio cholerae]CSB92487.1 Uncharacterised protein [Vibrio cholerae]CSB93783.1 Uncharacterised protein [Vibrio cholerae]
MQRLISKNRHQRNKQGCDDRNQLRFTTIGVIDCGTGIGTTDRKALRKGGCDIRDTKRSELFIRINIVAIFSRKAASGEHHTHKAHHR